MYENFFAKLPIIQLYIHG